MLRSVSAVRRRNLDVCVTREHDERRLDDDGVELGAGVLAQLAHRDARRHRLAVGAPEGNETFAVGGPDDHRSLELPAGASATTAPMCIGEEHKTMRFFATTTGRGALTVEAIYTKRNGKAKSVTLGAVRGDDAWAPTDVLPMRVNELAGDYDNAMSVSLRFTVRGNATWQIDDVYVDPFRMK
jgi:hypothetical protein